MISFGGSCRRLGGFDAPGDYAILQFLPNSRHYPDFINIETTGALIKGLRAMGIEVGEKNFPVLVENYTVMWALVKQGVGIGILDGNIGDVEPLVTRVLPDMEPLMLPIWLVAHRELTTSRRIRRVFDFLAEGLA